MMCVTVCIIVCNGVTCGAHIFTKLKFVNDIFNNFNVHKITGYTVKG